MSHNDSDRSSSMWMSVYPSWMLLSNLGCLQQHHWLCRLWLCNLPLGLHMFPEHMQSYKLFCLQSQSYTPQTINRSQMRFRGNKVLWHPSLLHLVAHNLKGSINSRLHLLHYLELEPWSQLVNRSCHSSTILAWARSDLNRQRKRCFILINPPSSLFI